MGNVNCGCRRNKNKGKHFDVKENHQNNIDPSKIAVIVSPYENITEDEKKNEKLNQTQLIVNQNLLRENLLCPSDASSRFSNGRIQSFLTYDDIAEEDDVSVLQAIFHRFFLEFYPMSVDIIIEMFDRKILTIKHAQMINNFPSNKEKSKLFFDLFVFSDDNLSKLADFLYLLLEENYEYLRRFNKSHEHFMSIVNLIYYILNIKILLTTVSDDNNSQDIIKYFATSVSLNLPKLPKSLYFTVSLQLNNFIISPKFWPSFGNINHSFQCCLELVLSHCNLQSDDVAQIVFGLQGHKVIRKLDFSSNPIEDEGMGHITTLFMHENFVQHLNISCCSITANGITNLLENLNRDYTCHLKELNMGYNDFQGLDERSIQILNSIKLTHLQMQSTNIAIQYHLFESLKTNYTLRYIDLSRNKLSLKDMKFLASGIAYNFTIKSLILAMIGLSKTECSTLNNALLMNKSIVNLDLSDNHIGDEGSAVLTDLLTMKKTLKELHLKRCNISPQGILNILRKAYEGRCNLRLLDLCFNHSARMSVLGDMASIRLNIRDLMSDISRLKKMKILLYGSVDETNNSLMF